MGFDGGLSGGSVRLSDTVVGSQLGKPPSFYVARICGGLPLAAGVSVFLLWLLTGSEIFVLLGIAVLFLGLILFAIGGIALARASWVMARKPNYETVRGSVFAIAALLVVNFPVAGGILWTVSYLQKRYLVTIDNRSAEALEEVRLFGGGCEEFLGWIASGDSEEQGLWFEQDGQLKIEFRRSGRQEAHIVESYVTGGLGGWALVIVDAEGKVSVSSSGFD